MAYVNVPKDLTKVKNKVVFNLTKRQLICFSLAAAFGVPFYFLTRGVLGTTNAMTVMIFLMLPAFLFAMYEKDGMHLEQVLMNIIKVKILRPAVRRYQTENYFAPGLPGGITTAETKKKKGSRKGGKGNE